MERLIIINECSKLKQKEYKSKRGRVRKVIHLGIVQEIEIWPCWLIYMHESESLLENETHKIPWDFEIDNGSENQT